MVRDWWTARPRLLAVTLALALVLTSTVALARPSADGSDPVRLIVRTGGPLTGAAQGQLQALGAQAQGLEFTPNTYVVWVPARAAAAVGRVAGVVAVERDRQMSILHHRPGHGGGGGGGTQPPQQTPWGITKIQAPAAWDTTRGAGVRVCVADTGIDKTHPDLVDNIKGGRNFTGGGPFARKVDPNKWDDGNGHGTHVAGTVAALDNTIGVVGVAPLAHLYIAKVLDDSGSGWISWIVDGLNWCGTQGAQVINMSFGSSSSSDALHEAIQGLAADGIVLVAASGNSGASQPGFPAAYAEVIAVGATDENDVIASWSNRGEEVNAPGVSVLSTLPGGSYGTYSGTSMASPHAAGTAALIIGAGVTDSATVRSLLSSTADAIAGGIRINAKNAVAAAAE